MKNTLGLKDHAILQCDRYKLFNLKKLLMITKISCALLFISCFQLKAETFSQTISLNARSVKLKKAFKHIEQVSNYVVLYNQNDLKNTKPVKIAASNVPLTTFLDMLLKDQPFEYKIEDKTILINSRKEKKNQFQWEPANKFDLYELIQMSIRGKVQNEKGEGLPGVTVTVKGSSFKTSTDQAGAFQLNTVNKGATLIFSAVGYESTERILSDASFLNVQMKETISDLDEVVVVGFGTQKKENLTGAVSSVKFENQLGDRPVNTIGTVLQGAAPGLQVTQTTGEPGGGFSMNVRGTTSINGGTPLILVDNVPFEGGLNLLNPADIESVSILKDAASASIYGARSAYGVILITTKKGKRNTPVTINYHNNLTINTAPFLPEKASPLETVQAYKDAGAATYYSGQQINTWLDLLQKYKENPDAYPMGYATNNGTRYQLKETDEMGDMLDNNGRQMNHNLSVRGGGENSSYGISLGTTNEDGILVTDKDKFNRYNVRGFVNSDIKPWLNVSLDMLYNNSERTMPNGSMWFQAATSPSYNPIDTIHINGEVLPSGTGANFIRLGSVNSTKLSNIRTTGKILITPIKQVKLNAEYTFDRINGLYDNYSKRIRYANSAKFGEEYNRNSSEYTKYNETTNYKALNIYGDYTERFGEHSVKLLAGFNQEERYYEQQYSSIAQMINDDLPSLSQGVGQPVTRDSYDEYAVRGFFGRINYSYLDRYLLEVNGRYDGSSKFPPKHRWGFFPSVSVGWRMTEETFMSSLKPYLSELKIRGSYGTVGNQAIETYAFLPGMSSFKSTWLDNNTQPVTLNPPLLVSDNFTWETVTSKNIGFDFGFFKNQLTGSFDLYTRSTKNMIAPGAELPAILGTAAPVQNVADLKTNGFELALNWSGEINNEFKYSIGANLYNYKAKITKFNNSNNLLSQYYVGQRIDEIWGYQADRYYTPDDFINLNDNYVNGTLKEGIVKLEGYNPNPGDLLFKDLNNDGVINAGNSTLDNPGDRSVIGNRSLQYQYGINGNFQYKGFSLSFNMQGILKRDLYLNNDLTNAYNYEFGTIYKHQLNYWTPSNQMSEYPRLYISGFRQTNHTSNYRTSTFTLLDGSYLRLQNVTLGYTINNQWIKKLGVNNFRIFASSENLYTWSKLPKGIDPAADSKSNGLGYPYMRSYSFGLNINL
ncbi:TonB-dependent receptor [Sphingobacterium spiritivorum]|uniref:TonB-dependent receptor n=1 Tax=Sphingobacterium spiritivorum TaxID=258 RepID=UPI003DA601BE